MQAAATGTKQATHPSLQKARSLARSTRPSSAHDPQRRRISSEGIQVQENDCISFTQINSPNGACD